MAPEVVTLAPGFTVSRIAKGNWQLAERHGAPYAGEAAIDDMRRFVEAGITLFDCADHYVGVERLIGEFRRRHPEHARRLRVSTKLVPDLESLPRLRRRDVESIVDTSLARLGQERLDLVQFHWWDYTVPGYVEAMHWLDDLRSAGKVELIGTTNFDTARLLEIVASGVSIATNQLQYSVLDHRPENGLAAFCATHGIKLLCYGTLAGGFIGERWLRAPEPTPPFANRSLVKYRLIIEDFGGWRRFQELLSALAAIARRQVSVARSRSATCSTSPESRSRSSARATPRISTSCCRMRLDEGDRDAIARRLAGDRTARRLLRAGAGRRRPAQRDHVEEPERRRRAGRQPVCRRAACRGKEALMSQTGTDEFDLYDLRVEVIETGKPFVMHAKPGDTFDVIGGRIVFPPGREPSFSLYAMLAVLPFIPAKQRPTHPNDWMTTDTEIASPDPHCGARLRITRLGKRQLRHADYSAVPL
jgi:uncharacterized repeat protein (TIGR04076 family)